MPYLGIDQSLTSTGICVLDDSNNMPLYLSHASCGKRRGGERLEFIESEILYAVNRWKPDQAVMEGYAYEAVGKVFELGEVGGIVKLALFKASVSLAVAAPSQVKKFAGNASADKEAMTVLVKTKWKQEIKQNDECDAYVLAQIARALKNRDQVKVRAELEVIKKIDESGDLKIRNFISTRSSNT